MKSININTMKKQAQILKEYLKKSNEGISHSSCLHAIAKIHGYKDWNTANASLAEEDDSISSILFDALKPKNF